MKKLLLVSLLALFGASLVRAQPTRNDLVARVETCEAILREIQQKRELAIPQDVLQRAKGLLIINQFKAGFLLGVQDGFGVLMVKHNDGTWSLPVLINAGEASIGLQLGAKTFEAVYVIMDEATPRKLFSNRVNIGVDAKAVAGPKAAEKERNNEEIFKAPLLAYTRSVGLYAGATVRAGHISRNDDANFSLYNTRYTMPELLYSDWVPAPDEVKPLMAFVQKITR